MNSKLQGWEDTIVALATHMALAPLVLSEQISGPAAISIATACSPRKHGAAAITYLACGLFEKRRTITR